MKKNILFSLIFALITISSCSIKDSDAPIPINDPSGDYLYISNSKYFSSEGKIEHEGASDGSMYVQWYSGNTNIDIQITPNIGYSYNIRGTNLQTHGDTTTFRISTQTVSINDQKFNLRGTNGIDVPNLGNYDGYYIKDSLIIYAFKSSNIENYESTETYTEGTKRN